MFRAIIAAFSIYSAIPMPQIDWKKKGVNYSLAAFPLVGLVIGILNYTVFLANIVFFHGEQKLMMACLMTALPLLVTGGIHMDGYMDTWDALSSYRDKEERLRILSDPHIGAFAVIHLVLYALLSVGFFSMADKYSMMIVGFGYIYSRILSGIAVVSFRLAKNEGMANYEAASSDKNVKTILFVLLFVFYLVVMGIGGYLFVVYNITSLLVKGVAMIIAGLLVFAYYRVMAYDKFGGITGDLAGFFLELCELFILIAVSLMP